MLFANLKDQAGSEKITIDEQQVTVKELLEILKEKYSLTNLGQVMVAINEEYSFDDDIVKSGDVVALIPPVSGG
nr:molybdopterin converting factor subunit 1 [Bacillus mesophilus]